MPAKASTGSTGRGVAGLRETVAVRLAGRRRAAGEVSWRVTTRGCGVGSRGAMLPAELRGLPQAGQLGPTVRGCEDWNALPHGTHFHVRDAMTGSWL